MATVKLTGFRDGRVSTVGDQDDAQIAGSLAIGDDINEDTITLNAEFTSDLVPDADVTYDLGSDAKRWNGVYGGQLNIQGQMVVKVRTISVTDSPYTVASDDYMILVDSSTGEIDVNLPNANVAGRTIIVKDSGNQAGTSDGKIRVYAVSGQTIDGQANRASNGNKGFITLVSDGTQTWYWTSRAGFSG